MRFTNLFAAAAACLLVAAAPRPAPAQTRAGTTQAAPQPTPASGPTADEDFELNIDSRRIHERDFQAETAVAAGAERGLRLKVGVALGASEIDVLLTGVRGRVRFRGNLAPVLRLLDARRVEAPAAGTPASPP